MFDHEKLNVSVRMSGKEYMEFKNSNKISLKSKKVQGIGIIIICLIALVVPIMIVSNMFETESKSIFDAWYESMPTIVLLSWSDIGKISFVFFAPFLVIMIAIAWVIHGFGFLIVRG